ncbi:hypothetical protein A4H97_29615 [Niastella yeongjuensis]|uniref:HTH gntR-type domain-containing protein n=1 Tax=Niastella yeongjuensis TaxID=354355 RepID=A0A1V9ESA7_9BACT|nr:GntR family transcriptional regulator [Niastella yeongjuensis]OQP49038.1 hypothetical protein A4H97_29615 [Niastella yeongjuensis]SEP11088.1 regulatory protein, gntR family [Niastella yeongjuensis]
MYPGLTLEDKPRQYASRLDIEIEKFSINAGDVTPVYLQLAIQLQQGIEDGQFDCNKPLPSVYRCNRTLGLSRATVFRAYKYLNRSGMVQWKKGEGFFVQHKFKY